MVGVAVVLLALPVASAIGTAAGLRLADVRGLVRAGAWRDTARLTGLGAPIAFGFSWFLIHAVVPTASPAAIQVVALLVGTGGAAALAARFTTPGE